MPLTGSVLASNKAMNLQPRLWPTQKWGTPASSGSSARTRSRSMSRISAISVWLKPKVKGTAMIVYPA